MGGQGGGVVIDWIVALAESQGYVAQATSVAGVAQRTGATLYYVELLAPPLDGWQGRKPVLALMPAPGEVDIVIGAELMEAGRAIQRGLVTPDRTTLIASTHRALAIAEKSVPGDGRADSRKVYVAATAAARQWIAFDMAALAERSGSVISAVLFGALAGSGALPFPRAAFEATIREGGVGVETSLLAFGLGYDATEQQLTDGKAPIPAPELSEKRFARLEPTGQPDVDALIVRAKATLPQTAHAMIATGLFRAIDFQDTAYGAEYLGRLHRLHALDRASGGETKGWRLTVSAAKHIARAMVYDDVIRVAELKTRAGRMDRIRSETGAKPEHLLSTTEFMHPRIEELAGVLPKAIGQRLEQSGFLKSLVRPFVDRPRQVRTGAIRWFLPLFLLGGLKSWRRGSLRHARETAHLEAWLDRIAIVTPADYALAVEMLEARRLIKGYGDTHARGGSKFDKVMAAAGRLAGRSDAADWLRRLRQAALADEDGTTLDGALRTIEAFADDLPAR